MAIYSIANLTTGTGSGAAALEVIAGSANRPRLMELGAFLNAATASIFGLGRPAAAGITPTSPKNLLAEEVADATSNTKTALAWGTGPTAPTDFFRRINLPATIGAGFVLVFPRGIVMATSGTLVLWNLQLNGAVNAHVAVDE